MASKADGIVFHVTGFGKFQGVEANPTSMVIPRLARKWGEEMASVRQEPYPRVEIAGCDIITVAAADADAALAAIEARVAGHAARTHVLLHFGVASGSAEFHLETTGANDATFRVADERGWQPTGAPINAARPVASSLRTALPVSDLVDALADGGHVVAESDNAGRFVCNWTYYRSLDAAERLNAASDGIAAGRRVFSLFVHVPAFNVAPLDDQLQLAVDLIAMTAKAVDGSKGDALLAASAAASASAATAGSGVGGAGASSGTSSSSGSAALLAAKSGDVSATATATAPAAGSLRGGGGAAASAAAAATAAAASDPLARLEAEARLAAALALRLGDLGFEPGQCKRAVHASGLVRRCVEGYGGHADAVPLDEAAEWLLTRPPVDDADVAAAAAAAAAAPAQPRAAVSTPVDVAALAAAIASAAASANPAGAAASSSSSAAAGASGGGRSRDYKMVIAVRGDLGMGAGKIAAQCCHAALKAAKGVAAGGSGGKAVVSTWQSQGEPIVVVKCDDLEHLNQLLAAGRARGVPVSTIRDAGRTQVDPGTVTVLAVGPARIDEVDAVTGGLRLL